MLEQEHGVNRSHSRPAPAWRSGGVAALACILLLTPAAGPAREGAPDAATPRPIAAFCSIAPQRYLIESVGGDLVSVSVLVEPDQSPHTFEPTPRQMADLAGADVYFAIGLPFESRILDGVRSLSAGLTVIDTAESVPRRRIEEAHGHDEPGLQHEHEDETGETVRGLPDPHVWLNPRFARLMAGTVCDALKELSPSGARQFEANLSALERELDELDAELAETLAPLSGESIYVFHPAFGYFTDAYGLTQVPVEIGGMEPGARELVGLVERATAEGVRVIFVQPQFSSRSARAIAAEIGGAVVPMDPLSGNYIENLRGMAHAVREGLGDAVDAGDPGRE